MMFKRLRYCGLLCLLLSLPVAAADADAQRGKLLYTTHCSSCHSASMHWREQKLARDLAGLQAQVRRWQGVAGLNWSEQDVLLVTLYLNDNYYHFPNKEALGLLDKPATK